MVSNNQTYLVRVVLMCLIMHKWHFMLLNPLLWQLECLSCLPRLPQNCINMELICNINLNSLVTFSAKAGSSVKVVL